MDHSIFAAIAAVIPEKGTALLTIARLDENEILVTLQPTPNGSDDGTARALQVSGPADTIASALADALPEYTTARGYAVESAAAVAAQIKAQADEQKANAAKRPTNAKLDKGVLTVVVTPSDATIESVCGNAKTPLKSGEEQKGLPIGKHIVSAKKDGYEPAEQTVHVSTSKQKITMVLQPQTKSLFDAPLEPAHA